MEREEARDVTAPSPAKRGNADMFHEVRERSSFESVRVFVRVGRSRPC